jgi:hypothetical protein
MRFPTSFSGKQIPRKFLISLERLADGSQRAYCDRMPAAIALWFPLWTAARSTGNDYFDAASTDGGANGLLKNLITGLHQ